MISKPIQIHRAADDSDLGSLNLTFLAKLFLSKIELTDPRQQIDLQSSASVRLESGVTLQLSIDGPDEAQAFAAIFAGLNADEAQLKKIFEETLNAKMKKGDLIFARMKILNRLGLHSRPSAQIVKIAESSRSFITLRYQDHYASADGVIAVNLIGGIAGASREVEVIISGQDIHSTYDSLHDLFMAKFHEE